MKRRPIKVRLSRARTCGAALRVLTEWRESYEGQMLYIIRGMEKAVKRSDSHAITRYIRELEGLQNKLFRGIQTISKELIQPDRPLDFNDPTPLWEENEVDHENESNSNY